MAGAAEDIDRPFKQRGPERILHADVRAACIDIGSNTTRLLVAEPDPARPGGLVEVAAHRAFVRLTADERHRGVPDDKVQAIAEAVAEQALTARTHRIEALRVVATAALRDAPGRDALLDRLTEAAGVPVEVLSSEEEAHLAFAGATAALAGTTGTVLVVDVGGGSTELAAGTPGAAVRWWASLPIGSGVLADAHFASDPPTAEELAAARADARAAVAACGCPPADVAWAVGGSATSLRRLCGAELTAASIDRALARLVGRPAFEAALDLDLHVERVRLLPAGLVLLAEIARAARCALQVGGGGLREGVVLDLLARVG
jgi:exopolyphosphatase/guanosine-5'-triphosphate,3'-diphosphate pyrophosphatase